MEAAVPAKMYGNMLQNVITENNMFSLRVCTTRKLANEITSTTKWIRILVAQQDEEKALEMMA